MCGIVAYVGFRDSKEVLLNGLKRIQYRGYDSMGLVLSTKNGFKRIRSLGDTHQLKNKVERSLHDFSGSLSGMGHSRWATHGAPLEKNAHPHKVENIYLVHNGIIENAEELKAWLKGPFLSDTDSEVVAHCLADSYQKLGHLKEAVFDTISKIKGEYAIAIMLENKPNEFFAFKKGPSLAIGVGEEEIFLSSDVKAFCHYTNKVIFLNDGEVVHVQNKNKLSFYSNKKTRIKKTITVLESIEEKEEDKKGYPAYMLKEIYEQVRCCETLLKTHVKNYRVDINFNREFDINSIIKAGRLYIVACGSSYYTALFGKYIIEKFSRIPVEVDMASEFRYRDPILVNKAPVLLISQSGETADTLAVLKMVKKLSLSVLGICNVAHSFLDRNSTSTIYMFSGVEHAVASTKAFTSTLITFYLLAIFLGRRNNCLDAAEEKKWVQPLFSLPSQMEEVLSKNEQYLKVAHFFRSLKSFIYLGRNIYYPLALEGALKMKELSYAHAEAYPAGEMKHGPLALVDKKMAILGLAPRSGVQAKTLANLEEVRSRGGKIIMIGSKGDKKKINSEFFLSLPICNEYLAAILCALPLQLMAYHTACALGHNVDQPRNLAKSVTVE